MTSWCGMLLTRPTCPLESRDGRLGHSIWSSSAIVDAAQGERLWPYVAVSVLGIRTEEARALRWSEVDLEAGTVAVPIGTAQGRPD